MQLRFSSCSNKMAAPLLAPLLSCVYMSSSLIGYMLPCTSPSPEASASPLHTAMSFHLIAFLSNLVKDLCGRRSGSHVESRITWKARLHIINGNASSPSGRGKAVKENVIVKIARRLTADQWGVKGRGRAREGESEGRNMQARQGRFHIKSQSSELDIKHLAHHSPACVACP